MAASAQQIDSLVRAGIESLGYELVCVELLNRRDAVLRLYVDGPEGVGVKDCEAVSRYVSGVLDVNEPMASNYSLEVSSPGADRPLITAAHFERFVGDEANVQLRQAVDGRKNFRGEICRVNDGQVELKVDGNSVEVPLDAIRRARLVPSFVESGLN
ncbi:MAG: ribosome maturation factor RimP [Immundisolibacteraceae bacterium]|nr:ribosome maturation factor RimP [Immundisolibacteraceae bacterium]